MPQPAQGTRLVGRGQEAFGFQARAVRRSSPLGFLARFQTGTLELGDARSETKRVFENLRAILQAAGSSLDHVMKCNVYLRDINDFAAMNEVYKTYFSAPFPARTTIQAGALPGGIAVEIECIAKKAQ